MAKDNRKKAISAALASINKKAKRIIIGWGHQEEIKGMIHSDKMPFPIPGVNIITGGGLPLGKFTTLFGEPGSGKSTFAYQMIAKSQADDPEAVWVIDDAENSLDQKYVNNLGVDLERCVIVPGNLRMEDALEAIRVTCATGYIAGLVVDSLGGFAPAQELEVTAKDRGLGKPGKQPKPIHADTMVAKPRVVNKFLRIAGAELAQFKMAQILIGHVYIRIDSRSAYTEYEQAGGTGLKHWAHLRLTTRRAYDKERKEDVTMPDGRKKSCFVGFDTVVRVDKTKQSATEGHEIYVPFQYGVGFQCEESIINSAFGLGIIEQRGAWFKHPLFPGEKTQIKGKEATKSFIRENPDILDVMSRMVLQNIDLQESSEEPVITVGDGAL
jgi:RecA/RadA recombinase